MKLDSLYDHLTAELDHRVEVERHSLSIAAHEAGEYEAYFKEVFGGSVF
ncbi:MAG TPA: hypothetical protein PLN96_10800 [Zoogloea sp.]|nr:hypothetical protein [Zoogloea sp.]HMV17595.1 hypothetical protein [Rhodocyclaceae bacterium]HMV63812.1 hypothetical protein [Rhodocyclaceae bacterium]HMW52456.1 hypothetical protein [Rhodocyclaceae bacterium]HMY49883.1 hypothetical protein [Rhodocyclaceae bacterium]HMZ76955.1 hypothetical protein [Rhodocyclaceae bacterium]